MIVIDSTTLLLFLSPLTSPPIDPGTGNPIEYATERVNLLMETLEEKKTKIIIPTPALAEVSVRAGGAMEAYMDILNKRQVFRIISFDTRAAVEHAIMTRLALINGDKKAGLPDSWAKVKFDRQIVAIAKAYDASALYSDDLGVSNLGRANGLRVIGLSACPVPAKPAQGNLTLEEGKSNEAQNIGKIR